MGRRQIRKCSLSNCTFFTNYIRNQDISPFLISHPNRFRSADLGDSFPPGEAMVLPHQPYKFQFLSMLSKTDRPKKIFYFSLDKTGSVGYNTEVPTDD